MGNKKSKQLILLIILLMSASLVVYRSADSTIVTKPLNLRMVLGPVEGYVLLEKLPLDSAFVTFLELDDYTHNQYGKSGDTVDLYIGYFSSLAKISAAHSPLVCFPGQGWTVSQPIGQSMQVQHNSINYSEIVASLEDQQQLVIYWFQANEKTSPKTYLNKLNAVINKITGQTQEHGFVRVSIPIGGKGVDAARETGKNFIRMFYPTFLQYINSTHRITAAVQQN